MTINYEFSRDDMSCSRITIDKDYVVVTAESRAFQYVDSECFHFDKIIYDEDVDKFRNFIEKEQNLQQFILVRVLRKDGAYRWCLIYIMARNVSELGRSCTRIELRDLVSLNRRYDEMDINVRKYRNFMGMISERFFEYDMNTRMIQVYSYTDMRCNMYIKEDIDEFVENSRDKGYISKEHLTGFRQLYNSLTEGRESFKGELYTSYFSQGKTEEKYMVYGMTMYKNGEAVMIQGIISPESDAKGNKGFYQYIENSTDSATGLLNKRKMTEIAGNKIESYRREEVNAQLWIVILDIDNFKEVNDTYGHYFGDEVIYKFATALKTETSSKGMVGRIGGDEFLIILDKIPEKEMVRGLLKRIRVRMEKAFEAEAPDYQFTTSIGVSMYPKDADNYERLFKLADMALYIAKAKGRNRYVIYDKALHGDLIESSRIHSQKGLVEKPMFKLEYSANMLMELHQQGVSAVPQVLLKIVEQFNLHGITVYAKRITGEFQVPYRLGQYYHPQDDPSVLISPEYLQRYDEHGMNIVNNYKSFEIEMPQAYTYYVQQQISSSLHFLIGDKTNPAGIITVDMFGQRCRKWSGTDVEILYVLMKFIGELVIRDLEMD